MKKGWMSKALAGAAAVLFCLTGCGKKTYTSSELNEMYADPQPEAAEVWLYESGTDWVDLSVEEIEAVIKNYNYYYAADDRKLHMTVYTTADMDYAQFQTKLQMAMMTGKGPDLILSHDPELFSDANKLVKAGALKSWDDIITGWEQGSYYPEVVNGAREADGKVYILPISYDPDVILTTEKNLEQYGLTAEDFSDFGAITRSILAICEQTEDEPATNAYWNTPYLTRTIPSIYDISAGKTGLLQPQITEILTQWGEAAKRNGRYRTGYDMFDYHSILDGAQVLEMVSVDECYSLVHYDLTPEEQEQLMFLPMRDTEGRMTGTIGYYALLPLNGAHQENIADFMRCLLMDGSRSSLLPTEYHWISRHCMDWHVSASNDRRADLDALSEQPMRLTLFNSVQSDFEVRIKGAVHEPDKADWEDLAKDLDIYLSE